MADSQGGGGLSPGEDLLVGLGVIIALLATGTMGLHLGGEGLSALLIDYRVLVPGKQALISVTSDAGLDGARVGIVIILAILGLMWMVSSLTGGGWASSSGVKKGSQMWWKSRRD